MLTLKRGNIKNSFKLFYLFSILYTSQIFFKILIKALYFFNYSYVKDFEIFRVFIAKLS